MGYLYTPFENLEDHYNYTITEFINSEEHNMMGMFSDEADTLMFKMTKAAIRKLIKGTSRRKVLYFLKTEWENISREHGEAFDTVVRENVFYYLDPVCDKLNIEQINIMELH